MTFYNFLFSLVLMAPGASVLAFAFLVLFLPICFYEAWIYEKKFGLSKKSGFLASLIAIFLSTFVFLPLIYLLYLIIFSILENLMNKSLGVHSLRDVLYEGRTALIVEQSLCFCVSYFIQIFLKLKILKNEKLDIDPEILKRILERTTFTVHAILLCLVIAYFFIP